MLKTDAIGTSLARIFARSISRKSCGESGAVIVGNKEQAPVGHYVCKLRGGFLNSLRCGIASILNEEFKPAGSPQALHGWAQDKRQSQRLEFQLGIECIVFRIAIARVSGVCRCLNSSSTKNIDPQLGALEL